MALTFSVSHGGIGTADLDEAVHLGDIKGFSSSADGSAAGISGIVIQDPDGTLEIKGLNKFNVEDDACDNPRIFTGIVAERHVHRGQYHRTDDARVWDTDLVDQNGYLQLRIINDARHGNRPAETDAERVAWLLDEVLYAGHVTNGTGGLFGANGPTAGVLGAPRNLDAADFRGQYANDVLADMGPPGNRRFFCYWDPTLEEVCLFYGLNSESLGDSDLRISNVIADQDADTFYPFLDAQLDRDPSQVYGAIYYKYRHGVIYREDPTTIATYLDRGVAITNDRVGLESTASTFVDRILDKAGDERDTITVTIQVPPERVNHVIEGQRIEVKFTHLHGYENFVFMHVINRTVIQDRLSPEFYTLRLTLSDYVGGFGTGGGGSGSPSVPFVPGVRAPDFIYAICNTESGGIVIDRVALSGPMGTEDVSGDWYFELSNTQHDIAAITEGATLEYATPASAFVNLLDEMGCWPAESCQPGGGGPGVCPFDVLPDGSGTFTIPSGATGFQFRASSNGYSAPCGAPYIAECWELRLWRGGAPTGTQPHNGQQVTEAITGTTAGGTLQTNFPYVEGSLVVNGYELVPDATDSSAGEFELTEDTTGETLIVTYQSTGDPTTGSGNPTPAPGSYGGTAGAPATADYLVGTAQAGLSAEIVVGATPGGELGGTWASPTVDATHSGSTHAAAQAAAEATAATALSGHTTDATDAHDASAVSVLDTGGNFTGTDVEAVLAELAAGGGPLDPDEVRDAGRWEIVMTPGITNPPEPVWTPDGTDYVYAWIPG